MGQAVTVRTISSAEAASIATQGRRRTSNTSGDSIRQVAAWIQYSGSHGHSDPVGAVLPRDGRILPFAFFQWLFVSHRVSAAPRSSRASPGSSERAPSGVGRPRRRTSCWPSCPPEAVLGYVGRRCLERSVRMFQLVHHLVATLSAHMLCERRVPLVDVGPVVWSRTAFRHGSSALEARHPSGRAIPARCAVISLTPHLPSGHSARTLRSPSLFTAVTNSSYARSSSAMRRSRSLMTTSTSTAAAFTAPNLLHHPHHVVEELLLTISPSFQRATVQTPPRSSCSSAASRAIGALHRPLHGARESCNGAGVVAIGNQHLVWQVQVVVGEGPEELNSFRLVVGAAPGRVWLAGPVDGGVPCMTFLERVPVLGRSTLNQAPH